MKKKDLSTFLTNMLSMTESFKNFQPSYKVVPDEAIHSNF